MPSEFDQQSTDLQSASSLNFKSQQLYKQSWSLSTIVSAIIATLLKSCLHLFTGKTEIQRIVEQIRDARYAQHPKLTLKLYKSLLKSKNQNLNQITQFLDGIVEPGTAHNHRLDIDKSVNIISRAKLNQNDQNRAKLEKELEQVLITASNYGVFRQAVIACQEERYNKECVAHEAMLMKLWDGVAIEPLENRLSKQWQYLGFQGMDPATDFRGMGVLSLKSMLSFIANDVAESKSFVLKSRHPQTGYPFAMLAINVTAMLVEMTKSGNVQLRMILYKSSTITNPDDALALFYKAFSRILYDIVDFWDIKNQLDLMNFAQIRVAYKKQLEAGQRYDTLNF